MWVRFTFITGPWIRLVVLPSPWMPPCNVPGICCSGIVVFLVYTCVFSQAFKQGAGCFTNGSWEWCCSYWGWEAFAFWVLRELRAGRGIYPHEQNIVVSASRDTLNFSVFLCLVSWLLVCSALILGHFLGRMEIRVLLCPTWSDLPDGYRAAVGCGGTGELRAKMPTVFLLFQLGCWALWAKRWLSLQTPAFNEHDPYCAPLCMECWWLRTVHWRGGGNLWTQLTHK